MIHWPKWRGRVIPGREGSVLLLFSIVFLFQLSMVKYSLSLSFLATIINSMMLLGLSIMACINIIGRPYLPIVWSIYCIPGVFVYVGYLQNLIRSIVANVGAASSLGLLIPWAAYLSVPLLLRNTADSEAIWRFFYRIMVLVCAIGVAEYFLTFEGVLPLQIIETPLGVFLTGGVTVFHMLKDNSPHYRFYGIFPEPGTFAMYLLPVLIYALVYKKYIGFTLFTVSLYLTDSLGGAVGFVLLVLLYMFGKLRKAQFSIGVCVVIALILATGLVGYFSGDIMDVYSSKNQSAEVRENNVVNVIKQIPELVMKHPLGYALDGGSMSNIDSDDYFGSNFALGSAFVVGGLTSLLGYSIMLIAFFVISIVSLTRKISDLDHLVVFPSLLVALIFIVQRATVMDSAIFSFLFAPSIIRFLRLTSWQPFKTLRVE